MSSLANIIRWGSASLAPVLLMAIAAVLMYLQIPGWGWFLLAVFLIISNMTPMAVPVYGGCAVCNDRCDNSSPSKGSSSNLEEQI